MINKDFNDALQKFIDAETGGRHPGSFEELQAIVRKFNTVYNRRTLEEFEGYSPEEMHHMLHFPFSEGSPLEILPAGEDVLGKVPLYSLVRSLLEMVEDGGEPKLTAKGNLPVRMVRDLYNMKFLPEDPIERGIVKLASESDSLTITLARILAQLAGLIKKRHNKISLTAKGKKMLKNPSGLFRCILVSFSQRFNWSYFDAYGSGDIGQLGFAFSFVLLDRYGKQKKPFQFYADRYFRAFPDMVQTVRTGYIERDPNEMATRCYSLRTFERFMNYLGIIELDGHRLFRDEGKVKTTPLFHKIIRISPPGNKT